MLEMLKDWAMMLSGVVVFGSLCEMILPGGNFQKYVRLAIGMLLVLTLVSPIRQLWSGDIEKSLQTEQKRIAYKQREDMTDKQKEEVMRVYKAVLNRRMKSAIDGDIGGAQVQVYCTVEERDEEKFGEIQKVKVIIQKAGDNTDKTKKILRRDFGVEEENVSVWYLKENGE